MQAANLAKNDINQVKRDVGLLRVCVVEFSALGAVGILSKFQLEAGVPHFTLGPFSVSSGFGLLVEQTYCSYHPPLG